MPSKVKIIGHHTAEDGGRRRVVMVDGVPYYESTGTSNTPGFGRKKEGTWWPFSGIEPQGSKWKDTLPDNWWMKGFGLGRHPDPERQARVHHIDWGKNEPNKINSVLNSARLQQIMGEQDWPEMTGARQVNEALQGHGWEVPMKGEYPQEVTTQDVQQTSVPAGGPQWDANDLRSQASWNKQAGEPMDIAWLMLKRQTKLYNWIPDYPGMPPIQQLSAQPQKYMENYLQGDYPDEFWSFIGDNPEDTEGHGASRHRSDDEGNYLAVGVRGESPIGGLPTRGPFRNIKDGGGVRVVGKDDMPDPDNIVVMPKNAAHMPQFDPKQKGEFRTPRPTPKRRVRVRITP
jgi:hypothetical protein